MTWVPLAQGVAPTQECLNDLLLALDSPLTRHHPLTSQFSSALPKRSGVHFLQSPFLAGVPVIAGQWEDFPGRGS